MFSLTAECAELSAVLSETDILGAKLIHVPLVLIFHTELRPRHQRYVSS